ncbi:MAG TPA: HAMP domain-containing sensor histidine kinase [Acidimicrobiales bacterium]|nr:HAMP domain-containing sensor histidine kinase [Acidimicrobiales bacterium]
MARGEPDILQRGREEVDVLRSRVLNVVGHELRTPVTTLRGLADALEDARSDAERVRITDALVRSARRLEGLVDDALVAMGVTTALPVGAPRAEAVAEAVRAACDAAGGPGEPPVAGGSGATAWVPPGTFVPALTRVLTNHLAYGEGPVEIAVEADGATVAVLVSSAGPDLSAADLALATEPFYRGERAVTTTPGLGLGLAVAKALPAHAGGALRLAGREGGGVTTRVEVPA